jgi:hypothetical protein
MRDLSEMNQKHGSAVHMYMFCSFERQNKLGLMIKAQINWKYLKIQQDFKRLLLIVYGCQSFEPRVINDKRILYYVRCRPIMYDCIMYDDLDDVNNTKRLLGRQYYFS